MMKWFMKLLAAGLLWLTITVVAYSIVTNHKLYFDYQAIEPVEQNVKVGEPLRFVSFLEVKKDGLVLDYIDILHCPEIFDGSFTRSEFRSASKPIPKSKVRVSKPWPYGGELPDHPVDGCLSTARITYKVFGLLPATQFMNSGIVNFVE